MAEHTIRVQVLLTCDEYLAMQSIADDDGLSDSAFMRGLLRLRIRERAIAKVSAQQSAGSTVEPAQVVRSAFHGPR